MDAEGLLEVIEGHVIERPDLDLPGIVDQDIDSALDFDNPREGPLDRRPIADVTGECQDGSAVRRQFLPGALQRLRVAAEEYQARALDRELAR